MATKEKRNARGVASTGSAAALLNVKSLAPAGASISMVVNSGPAKRFRTVAPEAKEPNEQARQAHGSDGRSQISDLTTSDGTRAETHATTGEEMSAFGLGDAVIVAFTTATIPRPDPPEATLLSL